MSKTFSRLDQGVESLRIASTVGYEIEPSEDFMRISVMPLGKTMQQIRNTFKFCGVFSF